MRSREPVVTAVYEKLGGKSTLGAEIASAADLARAVSHRIPLRALAHVQRQGLFSEGGDSAVHHTRSHPTAP